MDRPETAAVLEGDRSATVKDAARKPKARAAPKWETEARERLKAAIRRYSKPLADLVAPLAQVLVSDPVAEAIRKELWRQTGHRVDMAEIVQLISESVLRPGGLQG